MTMPAAKKVKNFSPSETLARVQAELQSLQELVNQKSQAMRPDRNSEAQTTAKAVLFQLDCAETFLGNANFICSQYNQLVSELTLSEEDLAKKKKNGFFHYFFFGERFIYDADYLKTEEELLSRAIQLMHEVISDPAKMTEQSHQEKYPQLSQAIQNEIQQHESDRVTNQQKLRRLRWIAGLLFLLFFASFVVFLSLFGVPSIGIWPIILGLTSAFPQAFSFAAFITLLIGGDALCNSFQHADRLKTVVTSERFKNTFFDSKKSPLLRQLDEKAAATVPAASLS